MIRNSFYKVMISIALICVPIPLLAEMSAEKTEAVRTLLGIRKPIEEMKRIAMWMFRQNDLDGIPGISPADRTLLVARKVASLRTNQIRKWLIFDLNGDLSITVDELRAAAIPGAYKVLRSGSKNVIPSREQAEVLIAAEIEEKLKADLNNDRIISFDEVLDSVQAIVDGAPSYNPDAKMMPSIDMDLDENGIVSDAEMEAAIDVMIALIDADGDGAVTEAERQKMQTAIRRKPQNQDEVSAFIMRALSKRPDCVMPQPGWKSKIAVIGGYEGSGMSNIHFGNTADTVTVIDLNIPKRGAPVYLVVALKKPAIIRVNDKSGRLRQVVMTGGEIALSGDGKIVPQRVHSDCDLDMWDKLSRDNPSPTAFFGERLGRAPIWTISDYTLGQIDLEGWGVNTSVGRLAGAQEGPKSAAAAEAWKRFEMFNPGGLVLFDPATLRSQHAAFIHDPLPQFAGVAELLESGVLVKLQGGQARHQVIESEDGEVKIGRQVFRPGGGDDRITFDGLQYTEERPGIWVGREESVYLATDTFTFPAGLTAAHAITVLVPKDMEMPRGSPGHSVIRRLE